MIPDPGGTPSGLYNETVSTTFPGTPIVTDLMTPTGLAPSMFYVPLIMVGLCIIGLSLGWLSILMQLIVMVVIIFMLSPLGIPPWIGILLALDGTALVIASKQFGW